MRKQFAAAVTIALVALACSADGGGPGEVEITGEVGRAGTDDGTNEADSGNADGVDSPNENDSTGDAEAERGEEPQDGPATGQGDEPDSDPDASLADQPVLQADGTLIDEISSVIPMTPGDRDGPPDTFGELVERSDAIVVARVADRTQETGGSVFISTRQSFEDETVIAGTLENSLDVLFADGVRDESVLEEESRSPQFRHGREYLLFLRETNSDVDGYWTLGPGEGRYLVEDGTVVAGYAADLQDPSSREDAEARDVYEVDGEPIIGQDVADLFDEH